MSFYTDYANQKLINKVILLIWLWHTGPTLRCTGNLMNFPIISATEWHTGDEMLSTMQEPLPSHTNLSIFLDQTNAGIDWVRKPSQTLMGTDPALLVFIS